MRYLLAILLASFPLLGHADESQRAILLHVEGTFAVVTGRVPDPAGSVAAARDSGTVTITWDASPRVRTYLVEVSDDFEATWTTLTTTTNLSATDTITQGETKVYRVKARNGWGAAAYSVSNPISYPADPPPEPSGKIAVDPTVHLTLVGGYRVPTWSGIANRYTAYPRGGMTCWKDVSGQIGDAGATYFWVENGENGWRVLENYTSAAIGTGSPSTWPLLTTGSQFTVADMFGTAATLLPEEQAPTGFDLPTGLVFDPDALRLLVTLKSIYWTAKATDPDTGLPDPNSGDPTYWLSGVEYPERTASTALRTRLHPYSMQRHGGGLTLLPADFANAHTGGKRLAFAAGALSSGQGGNAGPTLAAMDLADVGEVDPPVQRIMDWLNTAEVGADVLSVASGGNGSSSRPGPYLRSNEVERAFNDYGGYEGGTDPSDYRELITPAVKDAEGNIIEPAVYGPPGDYHPESSWDAIEVNWCYWPDTPRSQGLTQDGYFGTSTIRGGGTWIETDDFSCYMVPTISPTGRVYYPYQTENLSSSRVGNLYVYSREDLAAVCDGTMAKRDIRAEFYRWDSASNGGIVSVPGPRAVCYDSASGYLWIYYPRVWTSGSNKFPVVAAYSLSTE